MRFLRTLAPIGVLWLIGLAVLAAIVRYTHMLDRQFIFFPQRQIERTPADVALSYEDVELVSSDGVQLHGWYVPGESDQVVLWFHGNAGNVSHRVENLMMMHQHVGAGVLIIDYRGYGRSQGSPTEDGTYMDAEAAIAHLRTARGIDPESQLVLFGRSLGSAVAVEMATRHPCRAVILESPLTSIEEFARRAYPGLSGILSVDELVHSSYDSLAKIPRVSQPLLILHGDRDELIPFEMGRRLFDAAPEPKQFYTIEGAGHNDTYVVGGAAYFAALKRFIEDPTGAPD